MNKRGWPSDKNISKVNKILLSVIVFSNSYIVILPILPKADYVIKQHITKPIVVNPTEENSLNKIDRSYNHLILPTIQLDYPMLISNNPLTIHRGVWHRPNTNLPDKTGNTVLVGHRFTYTGTAVFYNLDKLKIQDDAYIVYNQKIYHYIVNKSTIVPPTATEIEAPSKEAILTLYTCTPLWTAKERLVFVAELKEVL